MTNEDRASKIADILDGCCGCFTIFNAANVAYGLGLSITEIGTGHFLKAVDAARAERERDEATAVAGHIRRVA